MGTKLDCEQCTGSLSLQQLIVKKLGEAGIDPVKFISSATRDQIHLIENAFQLSPPPEVDLQRHDNKLGVVVVKPNLRHQSDLVKKHLAAIGVGSICGQGFVYTPQEYYGISAHTLFSLPEEVPHGPQLFLTAICAQSHIITFRHLDTNGYRSAYEALTHHPAPEDLINGTDMQQTFDRLFVKVGDAQSIRNHVSLPVAREMGLINIDNSSCVANCWDFTTRMRHRSEAQNIYAFNGVHCPQDNAELAATKNILNRLL